MEPRLAELIGALSLATDAAAGLPPESALRTALIATRVARTAKIEGAELRDVFFTALLRFVGCTALAHEVARDFAAGEDMQFLAAMSPPDSKSLPGIVRATLTKVARGKGLGRVKAVAAVLAAPSLPKRLAESHCQLAVQLAGRLGVGKKVVAALGQIYERWDGRGEPAGVAGLVLERPARVLHLAWIAEVHRHTFGPEAARAMVATRSGQALEPGLADAFARTPDVFAGLDAPSVWDAFLGAEPLPWLRIEAGKLVELAGAFAHFADLKSPWTLTHSTGVARLADAAAKQLGLPDDDRAQLRVAALLHDLGRTSVPNGIWDKPGPLNPVELQRAQTHAAATGQVLALSPLLAPYAQLAAAAHERTDGRGYPRAGHAARSAKLLAAADVFHALTEARPHRPAFPSARAAELLADEARAGRLDREAVEAVLTAAGHAKEARVRGGWPAGLSDREVEVMRLLARGLSNKEIGKALFISPRTVQQHLRHVFEKTGCRSRAAAAVYALGNGLLE